VVEVDQRNGEVSSARSLLRSFDRAYGVVVLFALDRSSWDSCVVSRNSVAVYSCVNCR
jgi:hypothetical protein